MWDSTHKLIGVEAEAPCVTPQLEIMPALSFASKKTTNHAVFLQIAPALDYKDWLDPQLYAHLPLGGFAPSFPLEGATTMPTLLLTIFLIQLSIHLINTIGASTINEVVRHFSLIPPTSSSPSYNPPSLTHTITISNSTPNT